MPDKLHIAIAGRTNYAGTWAVVLACLVTVCTSLPSSADVHLPAIESDNMVLQAGSAQMFGTALPGEAIGITYGGRKVSTTADGGGRWQATLTKLKAGESFSVVLVGKNTVTIKNVLVGQVWLCSGQSNMEFGLIHARDADKEVAAASCDQLRLFMVNHRLAPEPVADVEGAWKVCTPATAAPFSAVGYFFGRALNKDLKTPVGLIESSWGGTPAQDWTSLDGLAADPVTQSRYWIFAKNQIAHMMELSQSWDKTLAEWNANKDKNAVQGKKPPVKSLELEYPYAPSILFNGMIAPIARYTIGGVIWYQGESNARAQDETMAYRRLFPALIKDWRKQFHLPELPFLFVQLANYDNKDDTPERSPWAELREAQLMTLSVPHTGMAVAVDIGDETNIHPNNKQDVGKRLERIAMAQVYGRQETFSGPIFAHLDIKNGKAICSFQHTDNGLKTRDGGKLVGFTICGPDKKFVPADAVISGNTVVVSRPSVSQPLAVRYAWACNPPNNLDNGVGLPASPFRSDAPPDAPVVNLPLTK